MRSQRGLRGLRRPRNVEPGDKRSPMHRLLAGVNDRGEVFVNYDAQWKTMWKAQRLGYVDERWVLTEVGRTHLENLKQKEKQ